MNIMKLIKGGITAPKGFKASGISAGIKKSGKGDLAIIFSEVPASASAMFTSNKVKAAPVILSSKLVKSGKARAIVVNSGSANACTGSQGLKDAQAMVDAAAKALDVSKKLVLVASTGSIGKLLPMKKIKKGIPKLAKKISKSGSSLFARTIMTTDTRPKDIAVEILLKGKKVRIGGAVKGAGMINPDLLHATMLGFISTDAKIKSGLLKKALFEAVNDSFNMVTVDNDRSTNDSVFALANGKSGCSEIQAGTGGYKKFADALKFVCTYLAKEIARDGEGATKFIEVKVSGGKTLSDARCAAKAVAGSNLVKAAVFGGDPNWGRIMSALGYSGVQINPNRIDISIGKAKVVKSGKGVKFSTSSVLGHLKGKKILFAINLNMGSGAATAWGCDLTDGYVKVNADYHT
jgi:glutamate N-acetyltransferase/amino-acid N-acetyltransferase